ncbi:MFS transporter [Streptomyces sp. RKAG293]|uniref:MFS transporter n=1 Tax=Streptomyces sp. RKAG293 TaxID=2893403 RepID=UPI00203353BB|nr:MFS transporter [Streptomyces sp. RKAG293]MCM2424100.1 MFS transporter [Streptomyces sp. RKAG293]
MEDAASTPLHRNRDYQRLWTAHALSAFGSQASYIALPLVLLASTHSVTDFGLVTFAETAASLLAGLPAGVLVDRLPRKAVLLACDVTRALAFTAFTFAVVLHQVSLLPAVLLAVVNSVLSAPFGPAASAALRHVVPPGQLMTAVSLSQARAAAVTLAGPMLGALLYTIAPALPFIVDAASYIASAACLLGVRLPREAPGDGPTARPAFLRDLTTGLAEVRRSPFLRYTLVNAAIVNFAFSGIVLVLIAQGSTSSGAGFHNGLIIAMSGAGNLLGSLASPRAGRTLSPRTLVLAVCWSTAALTPLLALDAGLPATVLIITLCSLATPAANTVISAAMLHSIPDHLQGRVQTACGIIPALIMPFGPLTASVLLNTFPPATALLANAALLAALALYSTLGGSLRHIPDLRKQPLAAQPAPSPPQPAEAD